jgi:site-specific recombinase XerD
MMLEELERRNYSEATTRCYIRTVEDFSRRFKCSPDGLGPEHIREYQAELFKKRKLSPGTVTQRLAALRFFYIKTLKKTWSIAETPYPKRAFHLPSILSREEVARLIDAALTPYHRTLLMTLYATGVRRAELTHLKISDIDSQCRQLLVRSRWRTCGVAASENLEFAGFQFQYNGARDSRFLARGSPCVRGIKTPFPIPML